MSWIPHNTDSHAIHNDFNVHYNSSGFGFWFGRILFHIPRSGLLRLFFLFSLLYEKRKHGLPKKYAITSFYADDISYDDHHYHHLDHDCFIERYHHHHYWSFFKAIDIHILVQFDSRNSIQNIVEWMMWWWNSF